MRTPCSRIWWLLPWVALAAGCVNLGAGTVEPTRFYLLQPLAATEGGVQPPLAGLTVAVGPVRIAGYLDRPYLVTRAGPNELRLAGFAQWGEPLEDGLGGVLRENLSVLLGTERVFAYPSEAPRSVDARVWADVARFDVDEGGAAVLEVRWGIVDEAGRERAAPRVSRIREAVDGDGWASIVAAESRCLAALSQEIAAATAALPPGPAAGGER